MILGAPKRSKIAQNRSKIGLNINSRKHTVSIPYFEDLVETNKKVIEGSLPRSLLGDIRSTQSSKIAQNSSKIGLKINSKKHMFL